MLPFLLLILALLPPLARGYASGAPKGVCGDMTPRHHADAQNESSPFEVSFSPKAVRPGQKVKVSLMSPDGRNFKGFFLQGRRSDNNEIIGTFAKRDQMKLVDCFDQSMSGATHDSKSHKINLDIDWLAPRSYRGEVVFRTTFVEHAKVFWVNVTASENLMVSGTAVEPEIAIDMPQDLATDPPTPFQSMYDGCYDTKGCFGGPKDCIATRTCLHLVTYEWNNSTLTVEMIGASRGWIAVAFSKDDKMGEDSVTVCGINGTTNRVAVFQAWNTAAQYGNEVLKNPQLGLSDASGSYQDGYVQCRFVHETHHTINERHTFNLTEDKYYMMLARGIFDSVIPPVRLQQHQQPPYVTNVVVDLKLTDEIGLASDDLIKLHGCLMTVAWVGTVSVAIFLARYFKLTWVNSTHCGQKIWFTWHRSLNIVTILLTSAGFVIIFVYLQDWSQVWRSNPHPILGVITTALMWIQPFMAACRCHAGTPNRPIFNWAHFLVGNSAHILAVITLFFAKPLNKAKLPDVYLWVLIAFVAFHVIVFLTMETFTCFRGKAVHATPIAMKDMAANGNAYHIAENNRDAPGSRFRQFMLSLYIFGNICFVVALVCIIALSPMKER